MKWQEVKKSLSTTLFYYWTYSFCIWCLLYQWTPRPTLFLTPGISWLPTFAFQSPIMKRIYFQSVSSRRSSQSSQNRSTSASSALLFGAYTWITVILNGLPWRWTEIILSFLRLHPSTAFWFDYDGYSISSKGFLPAVVDIMVIWVKFTHSSPF